MTFVICGGASGYGVSGFAVSASAGCVFGVVAPEVQELVLPVLAESALEE